jgi:formylglycine-generating enzyme
MEQIIEAILSAIGFLYRRHQNLKAASDLKPYFNYQDVKAKRDLFIESKLQDNSPTLEEEPGFTHKYVVKEKLIPFFIKKAFNEKKVSDKFYLVLADSGMGKTTFLINLFISYNSFFNFNRNYNIKLFPFGYKGDIIEKIKEIPKEEISKTILLLDAFDEYVKILPPDEPDGLTDDERFRKVLDEVIDTLQDFREVVITTRTQYFPGLEDRDYELEIPRFDDQGFHKLTKLYLSPFDDKEIRSYLNRKYGVLKFWNKRKKKKAFEIINNSPKLMVRPMLLYYIDFFIEDKQQYSNTCQIYDVLVCKWIEREAKKRKPHHCDQEQFKQNLYSFSQQVALKIYEKRKEITSFQLSKTDVITIDIDLKHYQMTGQSLLTPDYYNNWKFAHRSILEFFLAKEIVDTIHSKNCDFALSFEFAGMDMAQQFCSEILDPHLFALIGKYVRVEGGDYLMGSPDDEVDRFPDETQHEVRVSTFYLCKYAVTVADFHKFIVDSGYLTDAERGGGSYFWDGKGWKLRAGVNWRHSIVGNEREVGEYNHPVIHVSWNDAVAYCSWLSEKTGKNFRLPSEAEWEYACRAGESKPFSTGDNVTTEQANYHGDAPYNNNEKGVFRYNTVPVYYFRPNVWGLYNMHGNVGEWCSDWYDENYYEDCKAKGIVENPQGSETGSRRVLRGGSWFSYARYCRSADRGGGAPGGRCNDAGFRLAFVP